MSAEELTEPLEHEVQPGEPQLAQYGNVLNIPRETPLSEAIATGMAWAIGDFIGTLTKLGVDPAKSLKSLMTYYVPATQAPGLSLSDPSDPLGQRPFQAITPLVYDHMVFGWKVMLAFEGESPTYSRLEEGSRVVGR